METIRFSPIGKEDCSFGTGTFEVTLADGRVVMLSQIDIGAIINAGLSTLTLTGLTLTAPAISAPVLSGSASGTYTLGGTPTIASPTISSPTITSPTISSGAVTLTSGQIAFPATQAPSAGVNTLDDYEEGTWTPSIGGNATYTLQSGTYVKVGKLVMIGCTLTINAIGTGSINTITGLPFTTAANSTGQVRWDTGASTFYNVIAYAGGGGTSVNLYAITAATASPSLTTVLANSTSIYFTMSYMATA